MTNWKVTFKGDGWELSVFVEHPTDDLAGLIEKAKETANAGECPIKLEGYYEVSEMEVI